MTTSNTVASKVQFVTVNQASYLLVEKGYLTTAAKGLSKLNIKFSTNNLNDRVQIKLLNLTERLWQSLNAKYPCHITGKPLDYKNQGTFYKGTNGEYKLGLTASEAVNVVPRLTQLGIKFQVVTSWNDRYDGRCRLSFNQLTNEQLETLTRDYGNGACYQAINPNKPKAPKKQAKPAAKESLWTWGTNGEIPTVSLEQLEAIAASKQAQATPVEVQPDTDRTPSEQPPYTAPDKLATRTDFVNLSVKQLRDLADELGIDKEIKLKTELAKTLHEAKHFPQTTIKAMKKKK